MDDLIQSKDMIDMDAVIEWLKNKDIIKLFSQEKTARKELKELSSVTLQLKIGHWIIQGDENEFSKCSVCGYTHNFNYAMDMKDIKPFKFCPDCGAIMKNGE